ncbi:Uncharacterised protein [Sphingobacterium daejeonense]|nr:Uncharacterised protein [Sphingobacterium daejeonense]
MVPEIRVNHRKGLKRFLGKYRRFVDHVQEILIQEPRPEEGYQERLNVLWFYLTNQVPVYLHVFDCLFVHLPPAKSGFHQEVQDALHRYLVLADEFVVLYLPVALAVICRSLVPEPVHLGHLDQVPGGLLPDNISCSP